MKLGSIEFHILNDGTFRLDGGAMFGVIPKPMWERVVPPDERNRVTLTMNSLLIRAAAQWILVETGAGDKWDDKRRDIYAFEGAPRLPVQLAARGLEPEQIDIVVNTHLHFDHCGWNTRNMMGVRLSSAGHTAIFLSDLVPMTSHLPLPWIMGFDSYPLTTLENKKKWLPQIAHEGWLALFCHDGKTPAARLREQDGKIVADPVVVD